MHRHLLADQPARVAQHGAGKGQAVRPVKEGHEAADGQVLDFKLGHVGGAVAAEIEKASTLLHTGHQTALGDGQRLAHPLVRGAHLAEGGGPLIPRWRDEVQGRNDVAADAILEAHDVRVLQIQPPGQSLKGPGIRGDQA